MCGLSVRFLFNKIEVNGLENYPKGKVPVILASNHQSAFLDPIILAILSDHPVHFLARADVFNRWSKWFFSALNMMPIYRARDGYASLSKNQQIFDNCYKILSQKGRIVMFPESNQDLPYYLRPLTKGIGRIALNSQNKIEDDIWLQPVGINYFNHFHSGHKLIVNYGKPICVKDFQTIYNKNNNQGYVQLIGSLSEGIKKMMVIPENGDAYAMQIRIFNKSNEAFNFTALRNKLSQGDFVQEVYPKKWLWPIKVLVMLPNWPFILALFAVLKFVVASPVWAASIKMAFGALVLPLWFLMNFIIMCITLNWKWAFGVLFLQFICMAIYPRISAAIRGA